MMNINIYEVVPPGQSSRGPSIANLSYIETETLKVPMACITWKIKNFSTLGLKTDEFVLSRVVVCSGIKWHLKMYPSGQTNRNNAGHVAVYLVKRSAVPHKINAFFKICLLNKNNQQCFSTSRDAVFNGMIGRGPKCFVKRTTVFGDNGKKLLPNDTLTVYCEFYPRGPISSSRGAGSSNTLGVEPNSSTVLASFDGLSQDLKNMNEKHRWCDVTLKVRDQEFPCHKVILGARSPVFSSMFLHDMQENRNNVVYIKDLEPCTVTYMLQYIYTGQLLKLPLNEIMDLYIAADKYALDELRDKCFSIMVSSFSVDNISDFLTFCEAYNDDALKARCKDYFNKHAAIVVLSSRWKIFSQENPDIAQPLLEATVMYLAAKQEKKD